MSEYRYVIKLTCDAQPGTGLGADDTNTIVPKDDRGLPYLPGTHIKGLIRNAIREITQQCPQWEEKLSSLLPESDRVSHGLRWPDLLLHRVFGAPDAVHRDYACNVRVEDARLPKDWSPREESVTFFVTRTALTDEGTAKETSLRTSEQIATGTELEGSVFSDFPDDSIESLAWRLGLLAIDAVGGSRSRCGQCITELASQTGQVDDVAALFRDLDRVIMQSGNEGSGEQSLSRVADWSSESQNDPPTASAECTSSAALIELIYVAAKSVCVPDLPDRGNLITSGFCIPSSAVQGLLLHHFNRFDRSLSDRLFESPTFRCWPLTPCHSSTAADIDLSDRLEQHQAFDRFPRSIRVSLTHRAAKYTLGESADSTFFDSSLCEGSEAFSWLNLPKGTPPLKASDGVLLFSRDGQPRRLWRSSFMPRQVTTHGVVDGSQADSEFGSRRNLYSVEAMRPMTWRGYVSVPEDTADNIVKLINQHEEYRIGKGRSVRGRGRLIARRGDPDQVWACDDADRIALVLQSPVAIPEATHRRLATGEIHAEYALAELIRPWLEKHGLPPTRDLHPCWASVGLRFGWNRHSQTAFQNAVAVFEPGSVIALDKATAEGVCTLQNKLRGALMGGLHWTQCSEREALQSKQRGFGAIALHPGLAQAEERAWGSIPSGNRDNERLMVMSLVYELSDYSLPREKQRTLPRPSQIGQLADLLVMEDRSHRGDLRFERVVLKMAKDYLNRQCERRSEVRGVWEPIQSTIAEILSGKYRIDIVREGLKSLADVAVVRYDD